MSLKKLLTDVKNILANTADKLRTKESSNTLKESRYHYILDAGHGGIDNKGEYVTPGKRSPEFEDGTNYVLYEGELNRFLVDKLAIQLKENNISYSFTHDNIIDTPLKTRIKRAEDIKNKSQKPVIFISVHSNAYGTTWNSAHGWEVFYKRGTEDINNNKQICEIFAKEFKTEFPDERNRGIKQKNFMVINTNKYPSILLENFFMTNLEECTNYLRSEKGRLKLVNYMFNSIVTIEKEINILSIK